VKDRKLSEVPGWVWASLIGFVLCSALIVVSCGGDDGSTSSDPGKATRLVKECDGPNLIYKYAYGLAVSPDDPQCGATTTTSSR
jgi:hypothetical protein